MTGNVITTSQIAPSPILAPFVGCYSFREFETGETDMHKPFRTLHEISITFFFKAIPVCLTDSQTGQIIKTGSNAGLSGSGTQYNGDVPLSGT